MTKPGEQKAETSLGNPFQEAPPSRSSKAPSYNSFSSALYPPKERSFISEPSKIEQPDENSADPIPKPPYSPLLDRFSFQVSEDEWNKAMENEQKRDLPKGEAPSSPFQRKEMIALLLLLPGVVFFLFGLALTLFCSDGILTLKWNQNLAYFYFLGAVPLLYLGWRSLR